MRQMGDRTGARCRREHLKNAKRLNSPKDRRALLKGSILGGAAAIVHGLFAETPRNVALAAAGQSGASQSVVETTSGKVRGTTANGIHIFKGVPYGASTAGKNRFMPPLKPAPWTGVRDTLEYGNSAPQTIPGRGTLLKGKMIMAERGGFEPPVPVLASTTV